MPFSLDLITGTDIYIYIGAALGHTRKLSKTQLEMCWCHHLTAFKVFFNGITAQHLLLIFNPQSKGCSKRPHLGGVPVLYPHSQVMSSFKNLLLNGKIVEKLIFPYTGRFWVLSSPSIPNSISKFLILKNQPVIFQAHHMQLKEAS